MLDMVCFVLGMAGPAITYSLNVSYELTVRASFILYPGDKYLALAPRRRGEGRQCVFEKYVNITKTHTPTPHH